MGGPSRDAPEMRKRVVHLVFDHEHQHDAQWAAIRPAKPPRGTSLTCGQSMAGSSRWWPRWCSRIDCSKTRDDLRLGGRDVRWTATEQSEIIRLVEGSDLPVRQTGRERRRTRSTFDTWERRHLQRGRAGLAPPPSAARRYWNRDSATGAAAGCRDRGSRSGTVTAGADLAAAGLGGPFTPGIKRFLHSQGG